jgi:Domain of unknown function (DUF4390)
MLGLSWYLWLAICQADTATSAINHARLNLRDGYYVLSADIHYHFSHKAMRALQNGVPLYWTVEIAIRQQRDVLWDKVVVEQSIAYRLQYHTLLNMYRVKNQSSGDVYNFSTLAAALDLMSNVHNLPVVASNVVDLHQYHYRAAMRVVFDRSALPLPLRPSAFITPQWYLSSAWYVWPLK